MTFTSPPAKLVDAHGAVAFGMWNQPLHEVDLERATVPTLPLVPSWLRLKQWQHVLVVHPEVVITFAVVDAAYTHATWVLVVDRRTGAVIEHARRGLGTRVQVARSLWDEHTRADARGVHVHLHNHLDASEHRIHIDAGRGDQRVEARLVAHHDLAAVIPAVVCLPVGRGRGMYSHKVPLPVSGSLRVGERSYDLDPAVCTAVFDIHKAHYPRRTWWKWTTFVGQDARGRRVAVNLTSNVVEGHSLHENAVWIDGALHPLGTAQFQLEGEPWRMGTQDGAVSLTFAHDGTRRENLRLGVVTSQFVQRFGRYTGTLRVGDETIEVQDWFGLAEDHHAVW